LHNYLPLPPPNFPACYTADPGRTVDRHPLQVPNVIPPGRAHDDRIVSQCRDSFRLPPKVRPCHVRPSTLSCMPQCGCCHQHRRNFTFFFSQSRDAGSPFQVFDRPPSSSHHVFSRLRLSCVKCLGIGASFTFSRIPSAKLLPACPLFSTCISFLLVFRFEVGATRSSFFFLEDNIYLLRMFCALPRSFLTFWPSPIFRIESFFPHGRPQRNCCDTEINHSFSVDRFNALNTI